MDKLADIHIYIYKKNGLPYYFDPEDSQHLRALPYKHEGKALKFKLFQHIIESFTWDDGSPPPF